MNDGRSTSSISYQNLTLGCGGGKEGKVLEPFWRADKFLLKKKSLKRTPKIEETKNGNYLFQLMLLLLATNYKERRSNLMTTSSK